MKRAMKFAWSFLASMLLTLLLFFFLMQSARAPTGGRRSPGGRTIASLQEEGFDRRLLRLQLCYGVQVVADQCTLERRRVCKSLVIHHLESALARPGRHLRSALEFRCEDTAFHRTPAQEESSVSLRPNAENEAIEEALAKALQNMPAETRPDGAAREACEFLTDCKWAMRPQALSLRKIASCMTAPNLAHRKIFLDELSAMLFRAKASRRRALYPDLLEAASR